MVRRNILGLLLTAAWLFADSGAGVRWTVPANWKAEPQRPMRLATYNVPPAAGDRDAGECGVYYFGAGQGGSVDANLATGSATVNGEDVLPSFRCRVQDLFLPPVGTPANT